MKKTLVIFLVLSLLLGMFTGCAGNNPPPEQKYANEKIYWQGTIDDDFDDDFVTIVIKYPYNDREYTIEDFTEIGCIEVIDMWKKKAPNLAMIYKLILDQHSKQNVLDSIKWLEAQPYIHSAEPNVHGWLYLDEYPNDPYYTEDYQWAIDQIELPDAWDITTGSSI